MALFSGSKQKARPRKPERLLSSVVRETTVPAAVELLRCNHRFVLPNGSSWACLLLKSDAIGGLSRQHSRDEAKGSIIELIDSDQIQTVATAEMLAEEIFGIIPTPQTLERMGEFSLLTGATYAWAVLRTDPTDPHQLIISIAGGATFAQAEQVEAGRISLEAAVGTQAWVENGGTSTAPHPPVGASGDAGAGWVGPDTEEFNGVLHDGPDEADLDEDLGSDSEGDFDEERPVFSPDAGNLGPRPDASTYDTAGQIDDDQRDDGEAGFDESSAEDSAEETEEGTAENSEDVSGRRAGVGGDPEALVDEQQVRAAIARRFLRDDLDLEIGLEEFNAIFDLAPPGAQIETPEGLTGWLGDQVAQAVRQANAALAHRRETHRRELRSLYVKLMSQHLEWVSSAVSISSEGSTYEKLSRKAQAERDAALDSSAERVREVHDRIRADFETEVQAAADRAARHAEGLFRDKQRGRLERQLLEAGANIARLDEEVHTQAQTRIRELRRRDAHVKVEIGRTRVLAVIGEEQTKQLAAEEELLAQWSQEILRIVDENRKADISRAQSLAEDLERKDAIGTLEAEHTQRLVRLQATHADQVRQLEERLETTRREASARAEALSAEWRGRVELESAKAAAEISRSGHLINELNELKADSENRLRRREAELQADKESYATELERAGQLQSRSNKIMTVLIVAMALAAFLLGAVFGVALVIT